MISTSTSWRGAIVHVNAFQIHGRGLSATNLGGNYLGPSNIEAVRSTRLFDAFLQQSLMDDQLSVRAGQIALDEEFITSQYAGTFINSTFGWPGAMAADLPSGGPAYPLATPGLRVKYAPTKSFSWQTAVTSGAPALRGINANPQIRDRDGTSFNLNDHALVITEFAYAVYAVIDQMLLPKQGTEDQGLAGFMRLAGLPDGRYAISLYADAGLTYKGPFEGRESDVVGLAFSIAKISHSLSEFDRDTDDLNGVVRPVRNDEAALELTYQYAVAPWWTLQPDIQYIFYPAGNAAVPSAGPLVSAPAIKDAAIFGARTTVNF